MKSSNYFYSIFEYILETITVFLLFKVVINFLGLNYLGVWSLIMSLTSITSIGSSGFASSAVKFVAKYFSVSDLENVKKVIVTTFVTVGLITAILSLLIYFSCNYYGELYFTKFEYFQINSIIKYVLGSLVLGAMARVFLSSLDGMIEIKKRSIVGLFSKSIYFVLSIFLVKYQGLIGLAIGLFIRESISLIICIYFISKKFNENIFVTDNLNWGIFKEIFSYGYKFQLNSLVWMLTEPLTKMILRNFGSLSILGLYEILYKLFWQSRMLIIVVMNTYLPIIASSENKGKMQFLKFFSLIFFVSGVLLTIVFASLPIIIYLFKLIDIDLVYIISLILFVSLLMNLSSSSAFIYNLGSGNLNNNLYSTLIFAVINSLFGYIGGYYFGVVGVLVSWMLAHTLSSIYLLISYLKIEHIPFASLFKLSYLKVFIVFVLVNVLMSNIAYILNYDILYLSIFGFLSNVIVLLFSIFILYKIDSEFHFFMKLIIDNASKYYLNVFASGNKI